MWFRSLLLAVMLAVVFPLIGCSGDSGSGPWRLNGTGMLVNAVAWY